VDTAFASAMGWLIPLALIAGALRQLPRLIRDVRGPLPDIADAPEDAEPIARVLPNDDGLFTWSMRFPEDPSPGAPPDR